MEKQRPLHCCLLRAGTVGNLRPRYRTCDPSWIIVLIRLILEDCPLSICPLASLRLSSFNCLCL